MQCAVRGVPFAVCGVQDRRYIFAPPVKIAVTAYKWGWIEEEICRKWCSYRYARSGAPIDMRGYRIWDIVVIIGILPYFSSRLASSMILLRHHSPISNI